MNRAAFPCCSVALLWLALLSCSVAADSEWNTLLNTTLPPNGRFGLDGAPPGPAGLLPPRPEGRGTHWLVVYDDTDRPVAWHRFRVGDAGDSPASLNLPIDRRAPQLHLDWEGPHVEDAGGWIVAADTQPRPQARDRSGVAAVEVRIDGKAVDPTRWAVDRAAGRYRLQLHSRDGLGNAGDSPIWNLRLDRQPPQLRWQRLDPVDGVDDDVYGEAGLRLRLHSEDDAAGPARLLLHFADQAVEHQGGDPLELHVHAERLQWSADDGVGNRAEGEVRLRRDIAGPSLQLRRNGEVLSPAALNLSRQDTLDLIAVDEPGGVETACVEASIWYDACRELPLRLIGIDPGRYTLKLRARDRLGNRSQQRYQIEVTP